MVFSLSSSAVLVVLVVERPKRDPKPLNSGTSSFSGVAGLSDGIRFTSSFNGVAGLSEGARFRSSFRGVAGLSDGTRFEKESGCTAGDGLVWLGLKPVKLGLGDTPGLEKDVTLEPALSTRSFGLDRLGFGDKSGFGDRPGFGETLGFEKDDELRAGLTARSLGLADGVFWLLLREAAMIEAVELTPPNLAAGLIAGEGFVARVGEEGASREAEGMSVAIVGGTSCFGASGSTVLAFCAEAPPLLFFGPFALPLRTSLRGAPAAGGSLAAAALDLDEVSMPAGLSDLEPLGEAPLPGGPRARMLARPGLKRAASLLVGAAAGGKVPLFSTVAGDAARSPVRGRDGVRPRGSATGSCLISGDGRRLAGSVTALVRGESTEVFALGLVTSTSEALAGSTAMGASTFGFSLMLFWKRRASGVMLRVFSGLLGGPLILFFLPSSSRVANASGFSVVTGGPEGVRSCLIPASFSCFHCSFLAIRLSLSSSLRSVFWGPSVMVRDRLPRVMLSLRTSGATYFSCCALRRLPNLDMNSGVSWLLGFVTGRERSVLRKSVTGLARGSGLGVVDGFVEVERGGGMFLSNVGLDLPTSGLSGLGLVAGGDLTTSASLDASLGDAGF